MRLAFVGGVIINRLDGWTSAEFRVRGLSLRISILHLIMPTIAYLFASEKLIPSDLYIDSCCRMIFSNVLASSPWADFHLRSGGLLLWRFSYRTTGVERTAAGKYPSVSHTLSDDKELRATLAVTFAKSVAAQYHHIDSATLSTTLLRQTIECITASDLPYECSDLIHNEMTEQCPAYLGCFEVDKGDPLVLELAANGLIPFCTYHGGTLTWVIPYDEHASEQVPPSWAQGLDFKSVEFSTDSPAPIAPTDLSARGEGSDKLLSNRAQPHHAQKVLSALRDSLEDRQDSGDVTVVFGKPEFGTARADVRKLRDYSLNEQHPTGKHKALLFRKLLGITAADWSFLAEQLVAGLEKELVQRPVKSQWGVQYHANVPVTGRNGETKLVTSAWIVRTGEPPSLVSAYVADQANTDDTSALAHLTDIADAEGRKAAEEWTPTPMWITVYTEPIEDGACGSAWVRLPDGRSSFARWLKKNELCAPFSRHCIIFGKTTRQLLSP